MRSLLFIFVFIGSLFSASVEGYVKELEKMPEEKFKKLLQAYVYGIMHDWEYTLPAVAWKESNFDTKAVSKVGALGTYQVMPRYHAKVSGEKVEHVKKKLIKDQVYASTASANNLNYWKWYHGDEAYTKILASYNAGFNVKAGMEYAKDVKLRAKAIKKYLTSRGIHIHMRKAYEDAVAAQSTHLRYSRNILALR